MPRHDDMNSYLQQQTSPFDQQVLSKFLNISPKALGALEISVGIEMLVLSIWTRFLYLLWPCLISILTGSVTISAAHIRSTCQVRISQLLNCFSAIAAVVSIPCHCLDSEGETLILLLVCDVLIFILSVIVASTFCDCCKKSGRAAVSYINRDVPYMTDNNTEPQGQQNPFIPPPYSDQGSSALQSNYNPKLSAPLPKYDLYPSLANYISNNDAVLSSPSFNYDLHLSEPLPSYDSRPPASALNCDPSPSATPLPQL
ncbi:uncharacterized protein isoform X1 [Danio rerio]|uniref:Uncharacterized protein isoform X1 n=1 Tax=Danio rerio TaxID=7955 RepID=A0AA52Z2V8_DANRE